MGIPSYFRRILQKFPGCIQKNPPSSVKALCFDFNCLIYRCIRGPTMPVWSEETHDVWEEALLKEVCRTVKEVWTVAGRPKQVLLAVDGVVPMAKIRQQRVRRFKSAWLRKGESTRGWDSNSITPGTEFMEKLGVALKKLAAERAHWEVSDVQEPGEGEHKILQWLRQGKLREKGDVLVYGLDADLILLTMLVGQQLNLPLWLIREKQEFGGGLQTPLPGETQEYQCMNVREFQERLGVKGYEQTLNYIALMSFMGNDFVPHSVTHKLGDNGHEYVLKEVRSGTRVVDSSGQLIFNQLQNVFANFAKDEEDKLIHMITKKKEQASRGVLQGMKEEEGLPLQWDVEKVFFNDEGHFRADWKSMYWSFLHPQGNTPTYVNQLCQEYVKGCQWILDYYSGKPIDPHWMFPTWIPPLWSDLSKMKKEDVKRGNVTIASPRPQEQLAMVLPLESWNLIRDPQLKTLPDKLPHFWPESFEFFSLGRKWLWECEALLPPLRVERIRAILQSNKEQDGSRS